MRGLQIGDALGCSQVRGSDNALHDFEFDGVEAQAIFAFFVRMRLNSVHGSHLDIEGEYGLEI